STELSRTNHLSVGRLALPSFPTRRSSDLGLPSKVFDRMLDVAADAAPGDRHYFVRFARAATQRHADWLRLNERRQKLRRTWEDLDRKSTRLNSSHVKISYAVFCLKKKIHE